MPRLLTIALFLMLCASAKGQSHWLIQVPFASLSGSLPFYFQEPISNSIINKRETGILGAELRTKGFALGLSYQSVSFSYYGKDGSDLLKNNGIGKTTVVEENIGSARKNEMALMNKYEAYLTITELFGNKALDYGIGIKTGENSQLSSSTILLTEDLRAYKRVSTLRFNNFSYKAMAGFTYYTNNKLRLVYRFQSSFEIFTVDADYIGFKRLSGLRSSSFSDYDGNKLLGFATFKAGVYFQIGNTE